jgi:hypothetical protein
MRWWGISSLILLSCAGGAAAADQAAEQACVATAADRRVGSSQAPTSPSSSHDTEQGKWSLGVDGVAFGTFDRQGSPRGDTQFISQNWLMAMGTRGIARGRLTLTGMVSAEPATVGRAGYSEIFQEGEAYRGLQVTDHQHPHDLLMQLAAAWRVPLGDHAGFTVAGGPVGEPALGPVAFMHRSSSSENPTAPLSHHIFDSTHVSTGVLTAGLDRGSLAIEASVFRGREPDEDRYDLDFGPLDSWSARLWFRPTSEWTLQGSYGFLHQPEQLEPGDQRRTNGSVSWFRQRGPLLTSVTAAVGWNARRFSTVHALLLELTHQFGRTSIYSRFEALTVETEILLFPEVVHRPHQGELVDPIRTVTAGIVRDVADVHAFKVGIGSDVTFYGVAELLQFLYEAHPMSFHVFVRVRPPSRGSRMWNMTMGQPMGEPMAGHSGMTHGPH